MADRKDSLFWGTIYKKKQKPACCPFIFTVDSDSIDFSGDGTEENPLTAVTTGGLGGGGILELTSADFSDATTYNNIALAGKQFALFWNENSRFIYEGSEWTNNVLGGFQITIPGFNSGDATYHFYIMLK